MTHMLIYILAFVSAPQTTPRTTNMCGNIPSCFAPLDDRGDRTNQLNLLKLLHTSYTFLLSQAAKGRVFYSVDKCFKTGADPSNIFDKPILKVWTPCLSAFYCVIMDNKETQSFYDPWCDLARDFGGVEFERLRHRESFEISARLDKKL